ncbi:hypothetical protein [Desulfitobacterium sp. PCE1]|uniref:hypothetical protein n=1 Tax=Desulfitobacterium sp. PCE1 TaxID=146907 RepID=UPI000360E9BD|nr:hypothetical protein [Desulfitobacterium sp. PCE1]
MKRLILAAFLFIFSFTVIACSPMQNNTQNNSSLVEQNITTKDIEESKQVIKDHIDALNNGDLKALNKTIGRYKQELYNNGNIGNYTLKIESIEYPGQYTTANIPPSSYRTNYGQDPYKSMCLHVIFSEGWEGRGMDNWDYIPIKETEESPWVIHDWGG